MTEADQPEFDRLLGEYFGALGRPLYDNVRVGVWRSLQRMSIVEFTRVRDFLLRELEEAEPPRTVNAPLFWQAKQRMRSRGAAPAETPKRAEWSGDQWDSEAGSRFLQHIKATLLLSGNPHAWGRPGSVLQADCTRIAVEFKQAWAGGMREWIDESTGEVGNPPKDVQETAWVDCMSWAEAQIAALLKQHQARAAA